MAFTLAPAAADAVENELAAASAGTSELELSAQTVVASASNGHMGRFIQIRLNGVDLGDDRVEVLDFIAATARG
jgi:hypothetical protein